MKISTVNRLASAAAIAVGLAAGNAFALSPDSAYVPFVVNVDAEITVTCKSAAAQMSVKAGVLDTLAIYMGTTSVRYGAARQKVAYITSDTRGNVHLRLPSETDGSAEISLHSITGRKILRGNFDAAAGASCLTRANVAAGVYMLRVLGVDGNSLSNTFRLTHRRGAMNIRVVGAAAATSALKKEGAEMWEQCELRVVAEGYNDYVNSINITGGETNWTRTLDLVEPSNGDYETVTIGTQTWMKRNLNLMTIGSSCYNNSLDSCAKYGRLYSWGAARTACPVGWHLPSLEEWNILKAAIGDSLRDGMMLKAQDGWKNCGPIGSGKRFACEDTYGFSALPGGSRGTSGYSFDAGDFGWWWSATESDTTLAYGIGILYHTETAKLSEFNKGLGNSVRCVRDD